MLVQGPSLGQKSLSRRRDLTGPLSVGTSGTVLQAPQFPWGSGKGEELVS